MADAGNLNADSTLHFDGTTKILTADHFQPNKTLLFKAPVADGNSGVAKTIDFSAGNQHSLTLTGNVTLTFTAPAGPAELLLVLTQDATGSRLVTWPSTVDWAGGTAPTLTTTAAHIDIVKLTFDGTRYYGSTILDVS